MATVEQKPGLESPEIPSLWENGVTLQGVSWKTYEKFVDGLGDRRVFVTYDRGLMEIQLMSPSFPHENADQFLERFIYVVAALQGIAMTSGGSTTHRRKDLEKGIEPDSCFWIEHEAHMRGVKKLDLTKLPPPDLVIEVDVHASSVDRIESYRRLRVPEIWHITSEGLCFLVLDDNDYVESRTSHSFPFVTCEAVAEGLNAINELGETEAINQLLAKLKLR